MTSTEKKLTPWQEKLLNALVNKYENSATFRGENKLNQMFAVEPGKVFDGYGKGKDKTAVEEIAAFESEMESLQARGLIFIESDPKRPMQKEYLMLKADEGQVKQFYGILGRRNKREILKEQADMYRQYLGRHALLDRYCTHMLDEVENRLKVQKDSEGDLLKLLDAVLGNREDLLERELSMEVFGYSKQIEKHLMNSLITVLKKYGDTAQLLDGIEDENEERQILLGEYRIYMNPSVVYLKGYAELTFPGGHRVQVTPEVPLGFLSSALENLENIHIGVPTVMTVENLTSFHRMEDRNVLFIFLSGYHNTAKQQLIKKMGREKRVWQHFGDLDPSGFLILRHLRRGTGLPFEPVHMGAEELKTYAGYGIELSEDDRKMLENMRSEGEFPEVLQEMERLGIKVEQEIISLDLYRKRGV